MRKRKEWIYLEGFCLHHFSWVKRRPSFSSWMKFWARGSGWWGSLMHAWLIFGGFLKVKAEDSTCSQVWNPEPRCCWSSFRDWFDFRSIKRVRFSKFFTQKTVIDGWWLGVTSIWDGRQGIESSSTRKILKIKTGWAVRLSGIGWFCGKDWWILFGKSWLWFFAIWIFRRLVENYRTEQGLHSTNQLEVVLGMILKRNCYKKWLENLLNHH